MYYSEKEKWAFIHIPKNAGTTFIQSLHGRGVHSRKIFEHLTKKGSPHHNKYAFFKEEGLLENKEVFAFVRNPFSRALSLYLFTIKHCEEVNHNHHALLTSQGFKKAWMPEGFFRRERGNEDTLRKWVNQDTQKSWIVDADGQVACKYYKIEEDMEEIEKKFKTDMSSINQRTATKHGHYSLYYDDELREEIGNLFKEDLELFDYEFNND